MSWDLVAVVLGCLVCAAGCATGPWAIARLPPPEPEAGEPDAGKEGAADDAASPPAYADLAARPRLAAKLAVAGAVVGAAVGWQVGWQPVLAAWVYLGGVGVVLGYLDAQTRLLPTRVIAPSYAVLVLLLVAAAAGAGDWHDLARAGLGWLAMGGFYFVMWFVYPKGLGYGDVRLSGLLALSLGYLGWGELVTGLYSGFLLGAIGGGLLALVRIVDRRRYPFGPFMLLGALAGLVWGQPFADWYLSR
ncbi:MAG: prepilin peptidase [Nocardioidaceae bacterium]